MELLIISHTRHLYENNQYYGWGPTVREINFLCNHFDKVHHIAPVVQEQGIPSSFIPVLEQVSIIPTRNRGGSSFLNKIKVLWDSFSYLSLIWKEVYRTDGIVHVRCPANIALVSLIVLIFFPNKKKWIKYAGDWKPRKDHLSYKIQRFIIRYALREAVVTINGYYHNEKKFIHHILNPSFSETELNRNIKKVPLRSDAINVLFVGSIVRNKRVDIVIDVISSLASKYILKLFIIGDGPEKANLINMVQSRNLVPHVCFEGWKSSNDLKNYYSQSHFILLPSMGEGWPKVVSEAMAFGVVPIVSDVSSLKYVLGGFGVGRIISSYVAIDYAEAVEQYILNPDTWDEESLKAIDSAHQFTFEKWWENLSKLLQVS